MSKTKAKIKVKDELSPKLNLLIDILNDSPELVSKFKKLFPDVSKLFIAKINGAPGAEITIFFKPSPALLEFVSAIKAGDFK